jgi:hypothetical protein
MKKLIEIIKNALSRTPNGVSFFAINGYQNSYGEVANVVINIGAKLKNAKAKDLVYLKALDVNTLETSFEDKELLEQARLELIKSIENPNPRRSNAQKDAYIIINEAIKIHKETADLYIYGLEVSKEVLVEGEYPTRNSKQITIAKRVIEKNMKSKKFKMYKVSAQPEEITLSGGTETMIVNPS